MKLLKIVVPLLCLSTQAISQENGISTDSLNTDPVDSLIIKLNQRTIALEEQLKLLNQARKTDAPGNETETLAYFEFYENSVKDNSGKSYMIDSIQVYIKSGIFKKARLYTDKNEIFETSMPIPLHLFSKDSISASAPFLNIRDDSDSIELSSCLRYLPNLDIQNYELEEALFTLRPSSTKKNLTLNADINALVDLRIYSDLLSLLGKEENGLVQTEASSTIKYKSLPIGKDFYIFNYIKPAMRLSKFDSEFKYQTIEDTMGTYEIDRLLFNQFSYVDLNLTINIFRGEFFQHSFDFLNAGVDFKYSDIRKINEDESETINARSYFIETRGQLLKYRNFGFEFAARGYFQQITNSDVEGSKSYGFYPSYEFQMFHYPKSNPSNSIFLRFALTYVEDDYFSQLQFGYKSHLNLKNRS